jgi:hypothetical protein
MQLLTTNAVLITDKVLEMTRVNLVPPEELNRQMLQGEYKEITRIFGYARKAQFDIIKGKRKLPQEYTLGTGHCLFLYDKLGFVSKRYESLVQEMLNRGYKPNPIPTEELLKGIDARLHKQYIPTTEALEINRKRIQDRLNGVK